MAREQQITKCQTPTLGYMAAIDYANRRIKRGEKQTWCKTCERWQWRDERCELYVCGMTETQHKRLMRKEG